MRENMSNGDKPTKNDYIVHILNCIYIIIISQSNYRHVINCITVS